MDTQYSRQSRAERLIATARVVLAAFSLFAIWLDPSEPAKYVQLTYALLAGYLVYGLLLALLVWRSRGPVVRLQLLTHAFDLAIFTVFMYITEGPTSPFFVYFVFSLFCATLRWQWRGTLWTACVVLAAFLGMGAYAGEILHDPAFELNRFIIRSVYLSVVAILLGYLGAYEQRVRGELSHLAAWPRAIPQTLGALLHEVAEHAARVLGVPRLLIAWEEPEEPWLHLALWSYGAFHWTREPPDAYQPLVHESLAGRSFLCLQTRTSLTTVLYATPTDMQRWEGESVNAELRARFAMRAVLTTSLRGEKLEGYLFAMDKPGMTSDDLILGEIVAHQVVTHIDQFSLLQQLQQMAVAEERLRIARDLHDGLLQSLTVASLQLETLHRLLSQESPAVQERLQDMQRLLAAEQRNLRFCIEGLKLSLPSHSVEHDSLTASLYELAERIERHWSLRVELRIGPLLGQCPTALTHDIYFIVHEALMNAARHAHASTVCVECSRQEQQIGITVTDDGHGFPFHGHYDWAALTDMPLGPVTLKDRIAALQGSLVIDSTPAGSRLEIRLPLVQAGA